MRTRALITSVFMVALAGCWVPPCSASDGAGWADGDMTTRSEEFTHGDFFAWGSCETYRGTFCERARVQLGLRFAIYFDPLRASHRTYDLAELHAFACEVRTHEGVDCTPITGRLDTLVVVPPGPEDQGAVEASLVVDYTPSSPVHGAMRLEWHEDAAPR